MDRRHLDGALPGESLIERRGFDARDQMERYRKWYREGYLSSTGECFDIGNTVRTALEEFERTGEPYSGPTDPLAAGNGSIMRLAPVPLFYAADLDEAIERSAESSRTTHGTASAVDACRLLGALIVQAVDGVPKDELGWPGGTLHPEIAAIASGSFRRREPPEIKGSGYVVRSLEAALWALDRSDSFRDGCLLAVNLGEDADTTGAVYGQLAGALYGEIGIPEDWREKLAREETIVSYAEQLLPAPPGTYWVLPGRLLAGPYPSAHNIQALREAGVGVVVDFTEEGELAPYSLEGGMRAVRKPIRDFSVPSEAEMVDILDSIDSELEAGSVVYLHCRGGIGRSGTVAGCLLARHGLPAGRPPETAEQEALIRSWRRGS